MGFWVDKSVLVAIGGGIAAYKTLELIRLLREGGAAVTVVVTKSALRFVTPVTLRALAGGAVHSDLFDDAESGIGEAGGMEHIRLAQEASLVLIAPATAGLLSKMAGGHADDLLSTLLLARKGPVLAAPAMNSAMWEHPATRRNMAQLRADGIHFAGPGQGPLACGGSGPGRMMEPVDILETARRLLTPDSLAGRRLLITAGPTREELDPVRYLSNHSSGKMGWAVAEAALRAGAAVTLVHGPVGLRPPLGAVAVPVATAREMYRAALAAWEGKEGPSPCDGAILTAAVADFRPVTRETAKIKKNDRGHHLTLTLEANPDILAALTEREGRRRAEAAGPGRFHHRPVIGFAAETGRAEERGREKLTRKGCDLMVVNDVLEDGSGFGTDTNRVTLLFADGRERSWPLLSKKAVGDRLIEVVAELLLPGDGESS